MPQLSIPVLPTSGRRKKWLCNRQRHFQWSSHCSGGGRSMFLTLVSRVLLPQQDKRCSWKPGSTQPEQVLLPLLTNYYLTQHHKDKYPAYQCCVVSSLLSAHFNSLSRPVGDLPSRRPPTVVLPSTPPTLLRHCDCERVSDPDKGPSITEGRRLISNEPLTSYCTTAANRGTQTHSTAPRPHFLKKTSTVPAAARPRHCSSHSPTACPFPNDHTPQPLLIVTRPASQRVAAD